MKRVLKRELLFNNLFLLISSIFFIIVLTGLVVAVHEAGHVEKTVPADGVNPLVEVPTGDEKTATEVVLEESGDIGGEEDLVGISEDDVNKELGDGGVNSGVIHNVDLFFDGIFSNDEQYSRERAAEIRSLVKEGNYEEAKKLIDLYTKHADILEEEVNPNEQKNIERRSRIIRKAYGDMINDIPAEYRGSFNQIRVKEKSIQIAAEIATQVSELCGKLGKLDPKKFAEVCKIDGNAPKWKKELVSVLTEEQKIEAEGFGEIMSECFRTSGENCNCEKISFPAMSEMCINARPLAVKCKNGDTDACEKLDSLEFPEMPDYLRDIMNEIEKKYAGDVIGEHMPKECVEKGATTPEECMKIMVEIHAPLECKDAILKAGATTEREAREICEPIMFKKNAPSECVEAGATNPDECAKLFEDRGRNREGPGVEIPDCEELKGRAAVDCYNHASEAVDFSDNYYKDRREFRSREGEDFDPNKFDQRFNQEHKGEFDKYNKYEEIYRKKGEERYKQERTRLDTEELKCVERCSDEGKAWTFINSHCECRDGKGPGDYKVQGKLPYDCAVMFCDRGSYCDPYRGCVSGDNNYGDVEKEKCRGSGGAPITDSRGVYTRCEYGYKEGSTNCGSGYHWDSATKIQTSEGSCVPNNCPNGIDPTTGQCWQGGTPSGSGGCSGSPVSCGSGSYSYCENGNWVCKTTSYPTTTPTTNCPSGTYPEAGTCKSTSTQTSCGSGYHLEAGNCVTDSAQTTPTTTTTTTSSPPSETTSPPATGSVISGRAILENPFLKYYFS